MQVPFRGGFIQVDQPLRFWERQRAQEQSVENAENRGVAGHAECEHPDDHEAEGRLGPDVPQGQLQIVAEPGEQSSPQGHADRLGRDRGADLLQLLGEQFAVLQLLEGLAVSLRVGCAGEAQRFVAVLQVLRQLIDDFGLPRAVELQALKPFANVLFPFRHTRSP